jgi:hypothetical protein
MRAGPAERAARRRRGGSYRRERPNILIPRRHVENLQPGRWSSRAGPWTCVTSTSGGRGRPAPPDWTQVRPRPPRGPSGRPPRVRGRRVVCVAGGAGAAHGGGVGSRRARRSRARPYVWGMTPSQRGSGWPTTGTVTSRGEPSQVTGIPKGRFVPRQRLRPLRHGWQRLGVDGRLVCVTPRRRILHRAESPQPARGRLCGQQLPALAAGGVAAPDGRHGHEPHRVQLCTKGFRADRRVAPPDRRLPVTPDVCAHLAARQIGTG